MRRFEELRSEDPTAERDASMSKMHLSRSVETGHQFIEAGTPEGRDRGGTGWREGSVVQLKDGRLGL